MFIKSAASLDQLPPGLRPHVALIGRSNVGKSSFVNALAGQKGLAKVSAEPGRTRTLNVFQIDPAYYLIDLPGYGFAKTSAATRVQFEALIMTYLQHEPRLAFVFVIIDSRLGPTELDEAMLDFLKKAGTSFGIILNKTDKITRSDLVLLRRSLEQRYPGVPCFPHSIKDAKARAEIKQALVEYARRAKQEVGS